MIQKSFAARGASFTRSDRRGRSQRRDVMDFGHAKVDYNEIQDDITEGPDLDNAVSTLVVRALPGTGRGGKAKYWARSVQVITFPEVYNHYKDHATFSEIYDTWLEGAVVVRSMPKRGTKGSGVNRKARAAKLAAERAESGPAGSWQRERNALEAEKTTS